MKRKMNLVSVIIVMIGITSITTCSASKGANGANFGKYPADYQIAYVATYGSMVGLPKTLSVRDLFGPDAYFATSLSGYTGVPIVITLEETKGTLKSFTAQLLLSVKTPEGETKKGTRLQVTFESDSISEMSYMRYVKLTDLTNGKITEQRGYGDEKSDAGTFKILTIMLRNGVKQRKMTVHAWCQSPFLRSIQ